MLYIYTCDYGLGLMWYVILCLDIGCIWYIDVSWYICVVWYYVLIYCDILWSVILCLDILWYIVYIEIVMCLGLCECYIWVMCLGLCGCYIFVWYDIGLCGSELVLIPGWVDVPSSWFDVEFTLKVVELEDGIFPTTTVLGLDEVLHELHVSWISC